MLTEPADLDRAALALSLESHWRLPEPRLEYLPVGFGSHHWRAVGSDGVRRFVTVDDLEATFRTSADADAAFEELDRAFRAAAALRDNAALEFVVAPLATGDGAIIERLDERYVLTAYPFVDGESQSWGSYEDPAERRAMGAVLGRLHAATPHVPSDLPRRDDFTIPSRSALMDALGDLGRAWDVGPYAAPTRELLRAHARVLEQRLHAYDRRAARVRERSTAWVITHGEPHRANVIRDDTGGVHLVDWDTTLLAPRERDLRFVLDEELTGWDEYREHAGDLALDRDALELYAEWWELADIASFVAFFRRPHEHTDDAAATWSALEGCFAQ